MTPAASLRRATPTGVHLKHRVGQQGSGRSGRVAMMMMVVVTIDSGWRQDGGTVSHRG